MILVIGDVILGMIMVITVYFRVFIIVRGYFVFL